MAFREKSETITLTRAEIITLKDNNDLVPNYDYFISDRNIWLTARSINELDSIGHRKQRIIRNQFYTPNIVAGFFDTNYLGIYGQTIAQGSVPVSTPVFGGTVYYAIWGGRMWERNTSGTDTPLAWDAISGQVNISAGWTVIPYTDNTVYFSKIFEVGYDIDTDIIEYQKDNRDNIINNITSNILSFNNLIAGFDTITITDWGNVLIRNNNNGGIFNNYSVSLPATIRYNSNDGIIFNNSNNGSINRNTSIRYNIGNNSNIFNNSNNGDINRNSNIGFIIFNSNNGWITDNSNNIGIQNNSNDGSIQNNSNNGTIQNNSNDGNINNNRNTGFIISNSNGGSIISNSNNGFINSNSNNGNIIFNSNNGTIYSNSNGGSITSNSNIGNIFNNSNDTWIINNSNYGDINSNSNGGFINSNSNNGNIEINVNSGSIIFNSNNGFINSNSNNGDINNNSNNGIINNNTSNVGTLMNIRRNTNNGDICYNNSTATIEILVNNNNGHIGIVGGPLTNRAVSISDTIVNK